MTDLVVFVEEESAKIVLTDLAARFSPTRNIVLVGHSGMTDLAASFPRKIGAWLHPPDARFMILRDKDLHPDCLALKADLMNLVPQQKRARVHVRIVMSELEAWYLADPDALAAAEVIAAPIARRMKVQRKFRDPDVLSNAKQEFLRLHGIRGQRLLARRIAPHLDPDRSVSKSFKLVVATLRG